MENCNKQFALEYEDGYKEKSQFLPTHTVTI